MKENIFSGIGLGLVTGLIIGLSIGEVTGIILGALTSLITVFFTAKSVKDGLQNQMLIGVFCFSCSFSIILGIYIRTHNLLAPNLTEKMLKYKPFKFSEKEYRSLILFTELGLVPDGYTFSKETLNNNDNSVLMDKKSTFLSLCSNIDNESNLLNIQKAFLESGMEYDEIEKSLSLNIKDTVALKSTLIKIKEIICTQKH